ncbi:1333_t:CDS:2 [Paraglomus brasilianum]|uniref:1333_t:CDS:1 n=1 Tax=Paraglomus brasilianum TaxID=144538 RepID=A0A9N9G9D1_9GLOM|nr:1333_t:CDS:2 [Paraglomus brasilianum]
MPHKRKKATERLARRSYDKDPNESKTSDTPKRFERLLKFKGRVEQATITRKRKGLPSQEEPNKKRASLLMIHSLVATTKESSTYPSLLYRRVDNEMQSDILHSIKNATSNSKSRRYREKLKQKKLQKMAEIKEEIEAKDFDKIKDNIKFGEVVQSPPSLKILPKARGLKHQNITSTPTTTEITTDTHVDGDSGWKGQKSHQNVSAAIKRILENEREKVVAHYRMIKEKQKTQTFQ